MRFVLMWLAMLAIPVWAWAQDGMRVRPDLPSATQPVRRVPTTGYTLALSWAPEYCHGRRGGRADDAECAGRSAASGFTLHGLWPDGDGRDLWPQYCHPVALLSEAQMAPALDLTPSPQLLQHEWAKHGSCTGDDPVRYFAEAERLYRGVALPDMAALARRRDLTADDVRRAFAAANPGMRPTMLQIDANRRGWLEEVWICLALDKRPRPCVASQRGAPPGAALRIEAPRGSSQRGYARSGAYRATDGRSRSRDDAGRDGGG